jgi:rod shape-determining protein MreC
MRNILVFLLKYHVLLSFLLLEGIAMALTIRGNTLHGTAWFKSSNAMVGGIYAFNSNVTEYFRLSIVNRELAEENALLRGMLRSSQYNSTDSCDAVPVNDTVYLQRYTYIPATIVRQTVHRQTNHMTIDRGSGQGVRPDMAVISTDGIVGVVRDVSKNFATVLPLIHRKSSISARLRGPGYFGALRWDGRDPQLVQLHDIPVHVPLERGMEVETSGLSAMFPEGLLIGTIEDFEENTGENFHSITVRLNTDPRTLHTVYVVNNRMREEQLELESQDNGRD